MKNNKKKAQSLIEYGLILALVAVVAIAALQLLGKKVQESAEKAGNTINGISTSAAETYCTHINGEYDASTGVCKPKEDPK